MAITATFLADFTDFKRGADDATTTLQKFQGSADQAGGRLMDIGVKSAGAVPHVGSLSDQLRGFDGILATMGIHIRHEIASMEELGATAGRSVFGLGALATAGLSLGAGMAGCGLARTAMEFFQLDGAVAKAWTSVLGFADSAVQEAGAKLDVLALASQRAGREITSMSEAIKINKTFAEDFALTHNKSADALGDSARAVMGWRKEIDQVKADGNFAALTADMNSQNFSIQQLSVKYGIHVEALQFLTRGTKTAEDALKALDATIIEGWKNEAEAAKILEEVEIKLHKGYLDRFKAEAEAAQKKTADINATVLEGLTFVRKAQDELADYAAKKTLSTSDYEIREIWRVVKEEEIAFKGSEEQRAQYNKAVEALAQQQADAIIATAKKTADDLLTIVVGHGPDVPNATSGGSFGGAGSVVPSDILDSVKGLTGMARDLEVTRQLLLRGLLPHYESGGPVLQDGPIYAHAGEFVVPKGGGAGVVIHAPITINGSVLGNKDDIARVIRDAIAGVVMANEKLAA